MASLSSCLPQYPAAIPAPASHTSPTTPARHEFWVVGFTISTRVSSRGSPHPTNVRVPLSDAEDSLTIESANASASTFKNIGSAPVCFIVTSSVASASPYAGANDVRRKPCGPKVSINRSTVSAWMGSAPQLATVHVLKSACHSRCCRAARRQDS